MPRKSPKGSATITKKRHEQSPREQVTNASYFNMWATAGAQSPTADRGVLAAAIGGERWNPRTQTP